ncbi:dephospho-CoA kinase [Pholiota conissans]|uniref:Dephospho-CoA kinase n=1 Tax=Pholiota conissans TaxID=109636 RepID=A0A9P5Z003_9AGAR|nr:dephospho-CoA kinase [Pholiota conissans]
MLVVGLTGGIATGKSTVSALLKASNVPIVDADVIARQVVEPGTPALTQIRKEFGDEVLFPDGSLDRKKLGSIIFTDETKRKKLNKIVHPAVRKEMLWQVVKYWLKGKKYCIMDVPLLIEGGLWQWVGQVVVVYCSDGLQLQRLMQRDGSSKEDASSRLNSQLPISEKVAYADTVIDNSGSKQELQAHVDNLIRRLDERAGWSWRLKWLIPPFGLFSAFWTVMGRRLAHKPKKTSQSSSR